MDITDFKNIIWDLTRDISSNMDNVFHPIYSKYGLTVMQMRILLDIEKEEQTVGNLGKNLGVAGGNISSMCRKLEKQGYLKRVRNKEDERVVNIFLTDKGSETISEIEEALIARYSPCLQAESEENLTHIIQGLEKLKDLFHRMQNNCPNK